MANEISFGNPYAADEMEVQRRQQLAQYLQQQATQNIEQQTAGGWIIPTSPWQGINKIAQGAFAGYQSKLATQAQKDLAEKVSGDRRSTLADALRLAQGTPASEGVDDPVSGYSPPQAAKAPDLSAALMRLSGSNDPMLSQAGTAALMQRFIPKDPNAMIGKIDPKDYTPESFAQFVATSDATKLRPRVKQEAVNLGGTTQFVDPYAPPVSMTHTMNPGEAARLGWDQYQWGNPSAYQRAELANQGARIGLERANTQFNTGSTGMGGGASLPPSAPMPNFSGLAPTQNVLSPINAPRTAPQPAPQPAPAAPRPQVPQPAPQSAPSPLTPAARSRVAEDAAKKEAEATAAAKVQLPQTIATTQQAISVIDQMLGTAGLKLPQGAKEVAPHPGFQDLIGATWKPGARFIPGSNAADFQAFLDQVKGGAFMQAYQNLRGGGQITEVEGAKATAAITRMDKSQSEGEFIKAAREYQEILRNGMERAKRAAQGNFTPIPAGGNNQGGVRVVDW